MNWNIDIKDLFAKLKKGGSSGGKKSGGGMTAFFEKNPKMKIIIPAILLAISILAALVIILTTTLHSVKVDDSPVSGSGEKVAVLPDSVRDLEDIDIAGGEVLEKADLSRAKLTTIISNSDGYYTAVVETDKKSYSTLQLGDKLGDSWLVEAIDSNSITLTYEDETVVLKLD